MPTLAASTRIVFCSNGPLQEAVATGLDEAKEHNFFATQLKEYTERRDILTKAFDQIEIKYIMPNGSYFVLLVCGMSISRYTASSDYRISPVCIGRKITNSPKPLKAVDEISSQSDRNLLYQRQLRLYIRACWFIALELGVSSIPVSEVISNVLMQVICPLNAFQFYCQEHTSIGENYGRFAFCKDVETLKRAGERLQGLKKFIEA